MSEQRWAKITCQGQTMANSALHIPPSPVRLGLDYGACFTKMVLRAPELENRYVLEHEGRYEWPTRVTLWKDQLYFGFEGEALAKRPKAQAYTSLKMRMLDPAHFHGPLIALPRGLSAEDLVILSMAYFMVQGALKVSELLSPGQSLQYVLGCPELPDRSGMVLAHFEKLAQTAWRLALILGLGMSEGLPLTEAILALKNAKQEVEDAESASPFVAVRSEMSAVLVWMLSTPYVAAGKYAVLDIGASTSTAVTIEMEGVEPDNRAHKKTLNILGADRVFVAGDAVDSVFAWAAGKGDLSEVRGDEPTLWARHKTEYFDELMAVFRQVQGRYIKVLEKALGVHRPEGWSEFGLILVGGGSWIRFMREHMLHSPLEEMLADPSLINSGQPDDLVHNNGRKFYGEPDRLAAAYGLSCD